MERLCVMVMLELGGLILLVAIAVRAEMENLLCFLMRGFLGSASIYIVNFCLEKLGYSVNVGVNTVTFLTTAFLGIPGFLGLFGLGFYKLL